MRKAVINGSSTVENVIVASEGFTIPGRTLVAIPDGVPVSAGWSHDGEEFAPPIAPFEDQKAVKRAAVNAKLGDILSGGYSYDFGAPHGVKVLQTRDADDRINWLTSQAAYAAAIAGGAGAVAGADFRCDDDTEITLSYADGHAVLLAMAGWGKAVYARSWALKNAVAAAEDQAALDAIDIETGWPG